MIRRQSSAISRRYERRIQHAPPSDYTRPRGCAGLIRSGGARSWLRRGRDLIERFSLVVVGTTGADCKASGVRPQHLSIADELS